MHVPALSDKEYLTYLIEHMLASCEPHEKKYFLNTKLEPELGRVSATYFYEEEYIGAASLDINERKVTWNHFYPLSHFISEYKEDHPLVEKGIGSIVHFQTLRLLLKIPDITSRTVGHKWDNLSDSRKRQLEKMNIEGDLPFREYYKRSLSYVREKGYY